MAIFAIIAEYNPFHLGHLKQITKIKEQDKNAKIIAIMSASFVQRGTPAILDKYTRASLAKSCGVDLVLELPFPYCASSARHFARAGASIANSLGCVDYLCFGSECGDTEFLCDAEKKLSSEEFSKRLALRAAGAHISLSKLKADIMSELYGKKYGELLQGSNNILALEYIRALRESGSSILPFSIRREGAAYGDTEHIGELASATQIRKSIYAHELYKSEAHLPGIVYFALNEAYISNSLMLFDKLFPIYLSHFSFSEPKNTALMTEEIRSRIKSAAKKARSIDELFEMAATKIYSKSHIRRAALFSLLGVFDEDISSNPLYTCLLDANDSGKEILSSIRKKKSIEILSQPKHYIRKSPDIIKQFKISQAADNLAQIIKKS